MNDLISRQAAIEAISDCGICIQRIVDIPPAQQWIPFTIRPCTEQEKEEHPNWCFCIDCDENLFSVHCQLPDDGEEILITTKNGSVWEDTIFCDNDFWYLDSGWEIGEEAVAWMPKPKPYDPTQSNDSKALDALEGVNDGT